MSKGTDATREAWANANTDNFIYVKGEPDWKALYIELAVKYTKVVDKYCSVVDKYYDSVIK